jgi:hypothetical protein
VNPRRKDRAVLGDWRGRAWAGEALPTLGIAAWFARGESWGAAMVDACQAGEKIVSWPRENHVMEDTCRGRMKWAFIFRRKPAP